MYERDKKRYEEELKVYNNKKADGEAAESTMLSPDSKENAGNASKIKEEEIMYDIEDSKAEFQSLSNDDQDTKMEISMNDNSEHTSYNGDDTNNLNIDSEDDYNTTNDIDNDYQQLVDNDGDLESEQLDDNCDMMEDDDQNDS